MIRLVDRRLIRFALVGAMALALTACGRKSGLDAPPSSSLTPPAQAERQPSLGESSDTFSGNYGRTSEQPSAPPKAGTVPQKDTFFLDWLLR